MDTLIKNEYRYMDSSTKNDFMYIEAISIEGIGIEAIHINRKCSN